jgi:asparagine synthase (glutamine-hydrolysing)
MGHSIAHRGPDDSGYFLNSAMGVGLVHRRLAILDLSAAGHQPMTSASGRFVMVFNGEVYNFHEIRAELGKRVWHGHSDTEVMLEAIERWGLDAAVNRFIGMFAFALWDCREQKLSLVRDRVGIKPLYYGHASGDFVFASELKAICEFPNFSRAIDRDVLAMYMRHGYIPAPHCIYEGLNKLAPGCILTIDSVGLAPQIKRYWSPAAVAALGIKTPATGSDVETVEELHRTLISAVKLRMIADVPLGAFLSGGIDSSAVVALMQAQSNRPVKTFTIGFNEADFNEAIYAKKLAHHLGTDHTELYITPQQAMEVVPLLPTIYDEPFADSSQIPTYLVSKLARRSVTVSLSGDGGDELFGGYNRYLFAKRIYRVPKSARRVAAATIRTLSPAVFDAMYSCIRPVLPEKKRWAGIGDKAYKLAGYLNAEGAGSIYLRALSQCEDPAHFVPGSLEHDTVKQVIAGAAGLAAFEDQMMLADLQTYLPDDILTKLDRASMAVSLEARVPILDHRVIELAWRIPLGMKIRGGISKWILRQVLYRYVPQELVERPKMGFGVPIEHWLRGPLRHWAEDLLSQETLKQHDLLNVEAIRQKWKEHLSGRRNWQYLLWNVIVFQDWYRHVTSKAGVAIPCSAGIRER